MYAETQIVYADVLFMVNFCSDYLSLFITSRLINQKTKAWKMVLSSILGGFYSFFPYFISANKPIFLLLHISFAALMCAIAFGVDGFKTFFLSVAVYILSSALLGGLVSGLHSLAGSYSGNTYTQLTPLSFLLICIISVVTVICYCLLCKKRLETRWAEIKIHINDLKITAKLLADSGNLVTEPFSALPVIILSAVTLPFPYDNPESESFPLPLRAIPYASANGQGCFFGFRPKKTEIIRLGRKPKSVDVYIAIDTANNKYSGYDGIIPTSIL